MIKVQVREGIGNQLFIYAFARARQLDTGEEIGIYDVHMDSPSQDILDIARVVPDTVNVQYFPNTTEAAFWRPVPVRRFLFRATRRLYVQFHPHASNAEIERAVQPLWDRLGIYHITDGYVPCRPSRLFRDLYCDGYFQSLRFLGGHVEEIREELCRPELISQKNRELLRQIQSENSVCVHVRLGDYVNDPKARQRHYVCDANYFQTAMRRASEELEDPVFVIFSNDHQRVRDTIAFPEHAKVLFSAPDSSAVDDLQLMAQCKHFIIANSSYSWWAQFLSPHAAKTVYAPALWVRDGIPVDLYDDRWTRIQTPLPPL